MCSAKADDFKFLEPVMNTFVPGNFAAHCVKELDVHNEQEFSLSTCVARFKFPNLFLLFLLILKRCQKFFKTFLCCFNA